MLLGLSECKTGAPRTVASAGFNTAGSRSHLIGKLSGSNFLKAFGSPTTAATASPANLVIFWAKMG